MRSEELPLMGLALEVGPPAPAQVAPSPVPHPTQRPMLKPDPKVEARVTVFPSDRPLG